MAKLEIFSNTQKTQQSKDVNTAGLNLPMSLAIQQGQGINAITKAIGDIQNDLLKIESQNAVDAVKPQITKDIYNIYEEAIKADDTDKALTLFYNNTSPKNFTQLLKGQSPLVKKILTSEILKERDGLVPKLFSKVTTEQTNKFTVNLNDKFNSAIRKMLSSDQSEMGFGSIEFNSLINNKFYESQLGAKNYKKIVDDAQKLKNTLLLELDTKINPKGVIADELKIAEVLGTDAAKDLVEKSRITLRDQRLKEERDERFFELADAETKVGIFTNVLLRIDNHLKNPTDQNSLNELPTEAELYDLLDQGLINEPMFAKLSVAMTDEDGFSDDETLAMITTQINSANTIEQLDEIEKSYITDVDTLKALNNRDLSLFSAYIAKAKGNFESHKDFKAYSKLIDTNIINLGNLKKRSSAKFAENLATKKQLIQMSFYDKVASGMSPKNAYLDVLQNDFAFDAIPNLNSIPLPYFMGEPKYFEELTNDPQFINKQNKVAAEIFNKSNKTNRDLQNYLSNLEKIDFLEDVFKIRMILTNNNLEEATKEGIVSTMQLPENL